MIRQRVRRSIDHKIIVVCLRPEIIRIKDTLIHVFHTRKVMVFIWTPGLARFEGNEKATQQ